MITHVPFCLCSHLTTRLQICRLRITYLLNLNPAVRFGPIVTTGDGINQPAACCRSHDHLLPQRGSASLSLIYLHHLVCMTWASLDKKDKKKRRRRKDGYVKMEEGVDEQGHLCVSTEYEKYEFTASTSNINPY